MLSSWSYSIQVLLLLFSWRGINTIETPPLLMVNNTVAPVENTRSVVLKGDNHVENIPLLKRIVLKLECNWTGYENKLPDITGYWTKDGKEINNTRLTVQLENEQYNLKQVFSINEESLGNYSCVFSSAGKNATVDFHLAVPKMGHVRDKPIVSYVGDSAVISCEMKPAPVTWRWHRTNGTEKEFIDTDADSLRYEMRNEGYKSKLVVLKLTEADAGTYFCSAVYDIGASTGHVELKVITILEPLKPFVAILAEVVVLVVLILLYERHSSQKKCNSATGNGMPADKTNRLAQGEPGMEEDSTIRQRKA